MTPFVIFLIAHVVLLGYIFHVESSLQRVYKDYSPLVFSAITFFIYIGFIGCVLPTWPEYLEFLYKTLMEFLF